MFKQNVLLILTMGLSACTVGPNYKPVETVENIPYVAFEPVIIDNHHWWQNFNDENLNNLVNQAKDKNRNLQEATANIERAYAVFNTKKSERWPSGGIGSSYQAGKNNSLLTSDDEQITRGFTTGLSLTWDADLFGKLKRAQEAAEANAQQASILWYDTQLQIISQVVTSYGEYRGAQNRLFYAEMNLQFLLQSKDIVTAKIESGIATEFELAQIETQVYQVKTDISQIRIVQLTAKATLAALVAEKMDDMVLQNSSGLPNLKKVLKVEQNTNYLKYRPDVASAERALAASNANIGVAIASLYPTVSVSGFLGFLSSPNLALNSDYDSWQVAPSVQWSGLNLGTVNAQIKVAEANTKMALARFEQSVIDAVNDMQLSLASYQLSRDQLINAQLQFAASQKAVQIARTRYQLGSVDFLQLLDSERELLVSRDQMAQIELAHFLRLVNVYRAFGGAIELHRTS